MLAANTAFNGFPVLGSILARDDLLPRQLHTRGDRLAFSNGIILLAAAAAGADPRVRRRGHQADPALHRRRLHLVHDEPDRHGAALDAAAAHRDRPAARRRHMQRSRVINAVGLTITGAVLVDRAGHEVRRAAPTSPCWRWRCSSCSCWRSAGTTCAVRARARRRRRQSEARALPVAGARDRAGVASSTSRPCGRWPTPGPPGRRCSRRSRSGSTRRRPSGCRRSGTRADIPVPLRALDSPYREITRPIVDYVRGIRRESPRDLVVVFIPEYVVGHWWEQILHNQSALRLRTRLHYTPGVMVASVPWQLASSEGWRTARTAARAALTRRGGPTGPAAPARRCERAGRRRRRPRRPA